MTECVIEERCVIKLFGDPVIQVDKHGVEMKDTLFSLLVLLILWHERPLISVSEVVELLHPDGEAAMELPMNSKKGTEPRGPSTLRHRKGRLLRTLGLKLPENESWLAAAQAIEKNVWVDISHFDQKIGSADSQAVREAIELRRRGPLLASRQEISTLGLMEVVEEAAAQQEKKYQDALRRLIREDRRNQPPQAIHYLNLLLDTKGLSQEERNRRIRQVQELETAPVPPLSLPLAQSLPEMIGRAAAVDAIEQQLQTPGLVTLTGTGGIGKTRLAQEIARRAGPDHIPFIDLTVVTDAALLPVAVGQGLGLTEEGSLPWDDLVLRHLEGQASLLVWDNCEHLAQACKKLSSRIMAQCPSLTLLVTSREPLAVPGERTYSVPLLSLPSPDTPQTPEVLQRFEATLLFEMWARTVKPDFRVTSENASSIFHICYALDGLPLAIKLAAALVDDEHDVDWIAGRLDKSLGLLVDSSRTGSLRHPSLRAVFDLSYGLLNRVEQKLFRHLGAFLGGFSLEAAEAVSGAASPVETAFSGTPDIAGLLQLLVHKSLVIKEGQSDGASSGDQVSSPSETRFRLLATVRQYAQDLLREREEETEAKERHRSFYLHLAEEAAPHLRGAEQNRWLNRLEMEHDNLRTALASYRESGTQGEQWLGLARHLWWFWWVRGHLQEGRSYLAEALANAKDTSPEMRAQAHEGAGNLSQHLGDYETARRELEKGLTLSREIQWQKHTASLLGSLGNLAYNVGDYEQAHLRHQESLDIFRKLEDDRGILISLLNLGNVSFENKDYKQAGSVFREGLDLARRLKDERHIALSLHSLAEVARMTGSFSEATPMLRESLRMFRAWKDRWSIAYLLESFASLAAVQQQRQRAALIWGASEALREHLKFPIPPSERSRYDQTVAEVSLALGQDVFATIWTGGKAMPWEQAVDYALEENKD